MAKVISMKKVRVKKLISILKIPFAVLIVAVALFLSARLLGNVAMSNITDCVKQVKYVFSKGNGYPFSIDFAGTSEITAIGNRLLLLNGNSCSVLNSNASEQLDIPSEASDLKVVSENGRALVFSRITGKAVMISKTEKLGEMTEEGGIVAAAISRSGSFATGYFSDEAQSVLCVYNKRFKKMFQWNCSKERFSDISLSGNGKRVAVIAVGAENAEIYSRLLVFDIGSVDPMIDMRFDGTLLLRVKYTSSGKIIAAGDNKLVAVNKKGEIENEISYVEDSIVAFDCDDDGNILFCREELGGASISVIRISSNGKEAFNETIDVKPDCVDINGTKVAIVSDGKIMIYAPAGNIQKTYEIDGSAAQVVLAGNRIYTLESGTIRSY